jgi:hypothetical protein
MDMQQPAFDRTAENIGNIVLLEHVNVTQTDQRVTTIFYIEGLGLTRDPYMHVTDVNMWVNIGKQQIHSPTRAPQVLRGTIGIVVPDLEFVRKNLARIQEEGKLAGTKFAWRAAGETIDATCPWGNHIRVHGPEARFGGMRLGMPYVELPVPRGNAEGIARFYEQIMLAPARRERIGGMAAALVCVGRNQDVIYRETDAPIADYDGHHIAIYVTNFSTPHAELKRRGLVFEESDPWQYRFKDIVEPVSGKHLFTLEHEVRSLTHPMYGRPLVNRNATQTQRAYSPGHDAFY